MQREIELARQWFQRVEVDLRCAQVDLTADPPITEDACFHCQQAVEKTLKAFLTYHHVEFDPTHEIERLLKQCAGIDSAFDALQERAGRLTDFAVRFRYPYPGRAPDVEKARQALALARQVWDFVVSRLPAEVDPTR
jgi:HEPN domain-containing protein